MRGEQGRNDVPDRASVAQSGPPNSSTLATHGTVIETRRVMAPTVVTIWRPVDSGYDRTDVAAACALMAGFTSTRGAERVAEIVSGVYSAHGPAAEASHDLTTALLADSARCACESAFSY